MSENAVKPAACGSTQNGSFGFVPPLDFAGGQFISKRQQQVLLGFLLLGLLARCVRFFLCFPLWEDECFLCVNFISRGYLDLLEPLQYHQVAPPLFLWIELSLVKLLGFTEWSLRLFPFLCSIASLFLFRHLAQRLLSGRALVLAMAVFAVAYPGIRYAAEAKQYSSDLFVSLVLLTLVVEWWRTRWACACRVNAATLAGDRWLWGLVAVVPLAVWLSYPAVFVAGGVSLVIAFGLWTSGARRGWVPWLAYNVLFLASFVALFAAGAGNQNRAELGFMGNCWQRTFPPVTEPVQLPAWFLVTHTGDLLAYPVGGGNGASTVTFLCFCLGLFALIRRRNWLFLLFVVAPFVLHLTAAALGRYPYGGHVKFSQPLAPLICMLTGLGIATAIAWLPAGRNAQPRAVRLTLVLLCLLGLGSIGRDLWNPYKTFSDERARAFAIWFYFNAEFEGEVACFKTDFHQDFSPKTYEELSWAAMYLCNQRIYSPRHAAGWPVRLDKVTAKRPLRCLLYRDPEFPFDEQALARWLAHFQRHFRLVSKEVYPFPRYNKKEQVVVKIDYLEIYEFIPWESTAPGMAGQTAANL